MVTYVCNNGEQLVGGFTVQGNAIKLSILLVIFNHVCYSTSASTTSAVGYAKEKPVTNIANVLFASCYTTNQGSISAAAAEQGFPICSRLRATVFHRRWNQNAPPTFSACHLPLVELQPQLL